MTKLSSSSKTKELIKLFEALETTSARNMKEQILSSFKYPKLLCKIFKLTFSPNISFGVKSHVLNKPSSNLHTLKNADARLKTLFSILKRLSNREYTGNEAIGICNALLSKCTLEEQKLYLKIIDRSLRIGVSVKTVNKIFPRTITYPVEFMKGVVYNPQAKLEYPFWAEPKIDGIRLKLVVSPDGEMSAFTTAYTNLRHLFEPHLVRLLKMAKKKSCRIEVDGELFYQSWNETQSLIGKGMSSGLPIDDSTSSIYDKAKRLLVFNVFDVQIEGKEKRTLERRKKTAALVVAKLQKHTPKAVLVPHVVIEDEKHLQKTFKNSLLKGYEGLMLKDPLALYKGGRQPSWVKMKKNDTVDVKILEVLPGKGRLSDTCGSIRVLLPDGRTVKCSGMTDKERTYFWTRKDRIKGETCEIEYQDDPNEVAKARFCRFIRMRPDKPDIMS